MSQSDQVDVGVLWNRLVEANRVFMFASQALCAEAKGRVAVLGKALRTPGVERATALTVFPHLTASEQCELFPDLLVAARSAHGPVQVVWDRIRSLPPNWVLAHIEEAVDPILKEGQEDDYWMFLQLYEQLDRDLTIRLARRAAANADPAIRAMGDEYLEKMQAMAAS
jgi:hypothetical protein